MGTFLDRSDLMDALGFDSDYDGDDANVIRITYQANAEISLAVKAYTETTPVERGSEVFAEIRRVGLLYGQHLWFLFLHQHKQAEEFFKTYEAALKTLKESLKVEPTSRQEPIGIAVTNFDGLRKTPFSHIGFGGGRENLL